MDASIPRPGAVESRILIIMTGGTICMRPSDDGYVPSKNFLRSGMAPRPSFNDGSNPAPLETMVTDPTLGPETPLQFKKVQLESLRTPSSYGKRIRYCVYEFEELLDSSAINARDWKRIGSTIYNNYQLFDGFVVLHGTDSLAYTSSALSYMLEDLGKPVVLTGSQKPMMQLQNDATDNLLGSMIVAGHFMIPEVCLFFNYNLFRGNRATKISATDFAAFASPNCPSLATISAAGTKVSWHLVHRPTRVRALSLHTHLNTASVACLRIFPGIQPAMVDAVLQSPGLRGLVLETFGAGNAPSGTNNELTKVLANAVQRGIVIVNVTQCLSGTVSPIYASATVLGRVGVVFGHDMTSESALTKLAYLLALPDLSANQVAEEMSRSLRGELTETSQTQFHHPDEASLAPQRAKLTELAYAIMDGDMTHVQNVLSTEKRWLLNDADYLGNTPVHLAARGPKVEILELFLSSGASIHIRNHLGVSPLSMAIHAGNQRHVDLLQAAGAHLHAEEVVGQ